MIPVRIPRFSESAACAGHGNPDWWFPDRGETGTKAKGVCNGDADRPPCAARAECLAWAVDHRELGVWGGLAERERRGLRSGAPRNGSRMAKGRRVQCPQCDVVIRADSLARHRRTHVKEMAS